MLAEIDAALTQRLQVLNDYLPELFIRTRQTLLNALEAGDRQAAATRRSILGRRQLVPATNRVAGQNSCCLLVSRTPRRL